MLDLLSLQGSTENPTFLTILFTVLLSFLLSSLVAFTYDKTTEKVITPIEFMQSMILLSIVAATVMQAIGDSLARGLGMLGALAIIRFRTTLKTPRNMAFTFASLAVGISCGVYGFVIAITGTIGFCIAAFALKYSPISAKTNLLGVLKFNLVISSEEIANLEKILYRFCINFTQVQYQIYQPRKKKNQVVLPEKKVAYEYHLKLKKESEIKLFDAVISNINGIKAVKLHFADAKEEL